MKNVATKQSKNSRKVFTKELKSNIMRKIYNLFEENSNNFRKRGIFMKKQENVILNEIKNELNWKEKIIIKVFANTFKKVYNFSRVKSINGILN